MEEDKVHKVLKTLTMEEVMDLEDRLSLLFYDVDGYSTEPPDINNPNHPPFAVMKYCKHMVMAMLRGLHPDRKARVYAILAEQFTEPSRSFQTYFQQHEKSLEQYYAREFASRSSSQSKGVADAGG